MPVLAIHVMVGYNISYTYTTWIDVKAYAYTQVYRQPLSFGGAYIVIVSCGPIWGGFNADTLVGNIKHHSRLGKY